jgi:hypothetical protein
MLEMINSGIKHWLLDIDMPLTFILSEDFREHALFELFKSFPAMFYSLCMFIFSQK